MPRCTATLRGESQAHLQGPPHPPAHPTLPTPRGRPTRVRQPGAPNWGAPTCGWLRRCVCTARGAPRGALLSRQPATGGAPPPSGRLPRVQPGGTSGAHPRLCDMPHGAPGCLVWEPPSAAVGAGQACKGVGSRGVVGARPCTPTGGWHTRVRRTQAPTVSGWWWQGTACGEGVPPAVGRPAEPHHAYPFASTDPGCSPRPSRPQAPPRGARRPC